MLFAVATDGTADDGHVMALFCLHARKYRNHRHRTTAVQEEIVDDVTDTHGREIVALVTVDATASRLCALPAKRDHEPIHL
jgi:hypothetical protein